MVEWAGRRLLKTLTARMPVGNRDMIGVGRALLGSGLVVLCASTSSGQQREAQRVSLGTLAELSRHIGEYPCGNGILDAPVLRGVLRELLQDDYPSYLQHVAASGCGAIERRGSFLLMDVSQLHVGGYDSMIFVHPETGQIYLFWLQGQVAERRFKIYGKRPLPADVSMAIVDDMNSGWSHVAQFSWVDQNLRIELRK